MFVSLADLENDFREIEAAMAAVLTKLAIYDRSGDAALDGFVSTAVAIRTVCHMNPGVAKGHVELARKLETLPVMAAAFAKGTISRAHCVVIADAYTEERADKLAGLETVFVDAAVELNPRDLAGVVRRATDAIDGDGGGGDDEKKHERRRLHLSKTFDGMGVLDGIFDPADTDYLERAINTEMDHDRAAGDLRTTQQRRADAFMNLIRRGAVRGEYGSVRATSRHFVVAVDVEDFYSPARIEALRLEVRRNGYLSTATLERIACDADISRVIMAGKSEVLDVGRTTRTVSAAMWTALVARDGHCQAPGCRRPPSECEAHHLVHWANGGPTSLDNLKLLCWKHHRQQHAHDNPQRPHRRATFAADREQHTYRARRPEPVARRQRV